MAENTTGAGALSRRDFLTGSAVAAAGAAMLGLAAAEPAVAAEVRSGNWAADGSAAVTAEPSAATNATGRRRHLPRAQRQFVPRRRRHAHPSPGRACQLGLRVRHLRGGRRRRWPERGGPRGSAGRRRHLRGGHGASRRQRPGGRHVRHLGRLLGPGGEEVRLPELSLRSQGADRLGHGRVPLRGRPEAHLSARLRGRQVAGLDGRLRRALASGRGAGVRGPEALDAGPPRAEDEGRHRRHVQLRLRPRRRFPLPKPRSWPSCRTTTDASWASW